MCIYITRLSFSTSTVRANYAHVLVNERCTTESVPVLLCGPSERLLNSAIIQNSNIFDCLPMVHAGFLLKSGYLTPQRCPRAPRRRSPPRPLQPRPVQQTLLASALRSYKMATLEGSDDGVSQFKVN